MSGYADVSAALRMIAEGIDAGDLTASEFLVIGRTDDGRILAEDSGLSCIEAAMLCRDFVADTKTKHDTYYGAEIPRADRPRCQGGRSR